MGTRKWQFEVYEYSSFHIQNDRCVVKEMYPEQHIA